MYLKYLNVMFLWLFFLGNVTASPSKDEFRSLLEEKDIQLNDYVHIKYLVPGTPPRKLQKQPKRVEDIIEKDNEHFKILNQHIEAGHAMKGLTFTVYDDNMRNTAIALFRLLKNVEEQYIKIIKEWAYKHINKDIIEYAIRLASLHRDDDAINYDLRAPFEAKPNFFINSETILKALKIKANNEIIDSQEGEIYQVYKDGDLISINTNFSGWNHWNEDCRDKLDYFRQDIGLNSYYYGMHLLYPFWMSNDELSAIYSNYAEEYYYVHRNLLARYEMEKEHLKQRNISTDSKCYDDFIPYLTYENGLPFPSRSSVRAEWNNEYARIKSIDIGIKECITRGVLFIDNGTKVYLTEDNYVRLLTKLIRANYEGVQTAKSIRAMLGYGGNGYPANRYNPAPSVLHHPQTALRDPIYWYMMQTAFKYFTDYTSTLEPYDFSRFKSEDIEIVNGSFSRITTYYDYYHIRLNNIFDDYDIDDTTTIYSARQKRIKHLPFSLAFTVNSKINKTSLVKLFLGPRCQDVSCWELFTQFYELDSFTENLEEGINIIEWSSDLSPKYSKDDYYNVVLKTSKSNRFDIFKFPENLMVPKGLDEGLDMTLFILIVPESAETKNNDEPLGYPFHREVLLNSTDCNNYKFFTISVYHKENSRETEGYFSPHLN